MLSSLLPHPPLNGYEADLGVKLFHRSTIAGLGLSQMPGFLAAEFMASGRLIEVLHPYRPPEVPVWICYLDRRFVSPRIQAFVKFMAAQKFEFMLPT